MHAAAQLAHSGPDIKRKLKENVQISSWGGGSFLTQMIVAYKASYPKNKVIQTQTEKQELISAPTS